MCKHVVYTTIVNFKMKIVYRRKIKSRKKKYWCSSSTLWWWWWWRWWIVFVVWLTDGKCLALFPAEIIVRDPHHLESPARREQDLNLRRTWGFVKWSCAVVITTTPRRHIITTPQRFIKVSSLNNVLQVKPKNGKSPTLWAFSLM